MAHVYDYCVYSFIILCALSFFGWMEALRGARQTRMHTFLLQVGFIKGNLGTFSFTVINWADLSRTVLYGHIVTLRAPNWTDSMEGTGCGSKNKTKTKIHPEVSGSREVLSIFFVKGHSHDPVCGVEGLFHPITMVGVYVYVQYPVMVPVEHRRQNRVKEQVLQRARARVECYSPPQT